ncbi:NAD(P)H-binding protein [Spiractinospora alimapuensis]|uniref:NAD(P)H-binding protein n=1 Tax=Spiractinospora alimapuensis TaxID=2820884 RepID=UPI001F1C854F|nr:NAD(P)H-binding protein [Spiractinospora alimapuensis]QVQ50640.1 NAD(P)H-binding protein [Spiractinospora alimapuensis]
MFTIAGVTGHVGSAVADTLLTAGEPVTVLVRRAEAGESWRSKGARVEVLGLGDRARLANVLRASEGFFTLLPTTMDSTDPEGDHRGLADHIAGAVGDSGVPHTVMLSSIGAQHAGGTGPIAYLHHLEGALRATGTTLTALRPTHFQEKIETVLAPAIHEGVYPVFGATDHAVPMIATRDIGAVAAEHLRGRGTDSAVELLLGPSYTEREVAARLGELLGKELNVVALPRESWESTLEESGVSAEFAPVLAQLYDAERDGLLAPTGPARVLPTELDATLKEVLADTA